MVTESVYAKSVTAKKFLLADINSKNSAKHAKKRRLSVIFGVIPGIKLHLGSDEYDFSIWQAMNRLLMPYTVFDKFPGQWPGQ